MLKPVWIPYVLGLLNRRSASYRATFGGSAAGLNDHEELVRYDVEDPSAGAVGNGSSLARLFAAVIGPVDGRRLISDGLMNAARQPQASGRDVVLRMRTDWGLGFLLPGGPMWPDIGVPGLFGFPGASGSPAFADPEHQLAFGYTAQPLGRALRHRFTFALQIQRLHSRNLQSTGHPPMAAPLTVMWLALVEGHVASLTRIAGAEDLEVVTDLAEPVLCGDRVSPALHRWSGDLDCTTADATHQMMMVAS
jgi:CubicO group peptidase (beta-lactamase class C family)